MCLFFLFGDFDRPESRPETLAFFLSGGKQLEDKHRSLHCLPFSGSFTMHHAWYIVQGLLCCIALGGVYHATFATAARTMTFLFSS